MIIMNDLSMVLKLHTNQDWVYNEDIYDRVLKANLDVVTNIY
jgi:hypothetical protein